jgi:hypothetical protein
MKCRGFLFIYLFTYFFIYLIKKRKAKIIICNNSNLETKKMMITDDLQTTRYDTLHQSHYYS